MLTEMIHFRYSIDLFLVKVYNKSNKRTLSIFIRKDMNTMKNNFIKYLIISTFVISSLASCGAKEEVSSSYETENNSRSEEYYSDETPAEEGETFIPEYNQSEEYSEITENGFKSVSVNPLSTFSADVDTASYANVRRMINDYGMVTDTDAVRIEEMINYFDYNYSTPDDGRPFSVTTELGSCPWNSRNKLLSVGIKGKEITDEEKVPSNIVFLLDVSGSMHSDDKLPLMTEAFKMLSEELTADDRVSIVTYAGSDAVLLEGAKGSDYRKINKVLSSLKASGSTHGSAGINTAYELAEEYFIEGGNNRVILATDGDLNVGVTTSAGLTELIESKRDSGIYLSVLGFGTGNLKDDRMEALADNGNGNYSYIDRISEAEKVLVKEMNGTLYTIAKDVKLQVEFNPELVSEYRLIGYENRLMKDEDFYDEKKDAGEIGAGHTVTAMYEIVPVSSGLPLKYQKNETKAPEGEYADELLTVSIAYKDPQTDMPDLLKYPVKTEQFTDFPSENMQFASCVAEFGMLLRGSSFISDDISYSDITKTLEDLDSIYEDDYKAEFAKLVKKVADK